MEPILATYAPVLAGKSGIGWLLLTIQEFFSWPRLNFMTIIITEKLLNLTFFGIL